MDKAYEFARIKHEGQFRKFTGEPYIVHPLQVANMYSLFYPDDVVGYEAALLHDTVEDTDATLDEIHEMFGRCVRDTVDGLTKPEVEGNRALRKAAQRKKLAQQDERVQKIKLCDMYCNCIDIVIQDPDFARVYIKECLETAWALNKVNNTPLSILVCNTLVTMSKNMSIMNSK